MTYRDCKTSLSALEIPEPIVDHFVQFSVWVDLLAPTQANRNVEYRPSAHFVERRPSVAADFVNCQRFGNLQIAIDRRSP